MNSMKANSVVVSLLLLVGLRFPVFAASAEVVDRVLVVAAGRAVTWVAALTDANCHAFLTGQPPIQLGLHDPGAVEQLRPAIDRLTDQIVIERLRQRSQLAGDSADDMIAKVDGLWRELLVNHSSSEQLLRALQSYGLDEQTLRARLAREQRVLAFLDFSLRPQIRIESEQVAAYYQTEFLPRLQREQPAAEPPPLDEVRVRIEEILVQNEMNRQMGPWLEGLRIEHGVRQMSAGENMNR